MTNQWTINWQIIILLLHVWGRDSIVGIVTRYGLEGPGIESWWGQDFLHVSRPAPEPTQSPVQWVPGRSRGWRRPGRGGHPPPSSAGHERVELYFYSPSGSMWPTTGWNLTLPSYMFWHHCVILRELVFSTLLCYTSKLMQFLVIQFKIPYMSK
jgi:hypothetical protein